MYLNRKNDWVKNTNKISTQLTSFSFFFSLVCEKYSKIHITNQSRSTVGPNPKLSFKKVNFANERINVFSIFLLEERGKRVKNTNLEGGYH